MPGPASAAEMREIEAGMPSARAHSSPAGLLSTELDGACARILLSNGGDDGLPVPLGERVRFRGERGRKSGGRVAESPAPLADFYLRPGEYRVADGGSRIHALLGSCVSITLWHPNLRVRAMCHFLLSSRPTRCPGVVEGGFLTERASLGPRDIAPPRARSRSGGATSERTRCQFGW